MFFWIRSQKISDDIQALVRGTHELANGRNLAPIQVLSGGELRQLSDQINAIVELTANKDRYGMKGKSGESSC